MGKAGDILFDEDGVMQIANGDIVFGDANGQLQKRLMNCEKGENTMAPLKGVGVGSWILSEDDGEDLRKEIQSQFEADGVRLDSLLVDGEKVQTLGTYVS